MMGEMSKKQIEFFVILIWVAVLTAIAILVIDFQIKGAIIEQAIKLREAMNGQTGKTTASQRPDNNGSNNAAYPNDMVASGNARMEAKRSVPSRQNGANPLISRDEIVGGTEFDTSGIPSEGE
jgi:hypothetical protein